MGGRDKQADRKYHQANILKPLKVCLVVEMISYWIDIWRQVHSEVFPAMSFIPCFIWHSALVETIKLLFHVFLDVNGQKDREGVFASFENIIEVSL